MSERRLIEEALARNTVTPEEREVATLRAENAALREQVAAQHCPDDAACRDAEVQRLQAENEKLWARKLAFDLAVAKARNDR
jgi:hypothetical protein